MFFYEQKKKKKKKKKKASILCTAFFFFFSALGQHTQRIKRLYIPNQQLKWTQIQLLRPQTLKQTLEQRKSLNERVKKKREIKKWNWKLMFF